MRLRVLIWMLVLGGLALPNMALFPAVAQETVDLSPQLAKIRAIGKAGQGHAEAVAAIKQVSQAPATVLPKLPPNGPSAPGRVCRSSSLKCSSPTPSTRRAAAAWPTN